MSEPVNLLKQTSEALLPDGESALGRDPETLRARITEYSDARKIFTDWVRTGLRPGVDWACVHLKVGTKDKEPCDDRFNKKIFKCSKCYGRAMLMKSGAEEVMGFFRLRAAFETDEKTIKNLGRKDVVAYICRLVDCNGEVMGEGRGARDLKSDYGDTNKSIKMAMKSAHEDAILRVAGLTGVFVPTSGAAKEPLPPGKAKGARSASQKAQPKVSKSVQNTIDNWNLQFEQCETLEALKKCAADLAFEQPEGSQVRTLCLPTYAKCFKKFSVQDPPAGDDLDIPDDEIPE